MAPWWEKLAAGGSGGLTDTARYPSSPACVVQGQLAALTGFRGISERASVSPLLSEEAPGGCDRAAEGWGAGGAARGHRDGG